MKVVKSVSISEEKKKNLSTQLQIIGIHVHNQQTSVEEIQLYNQENLASYHLQLH